jgi:hypothetical protein
MSARGQETPEQEGEQEGTENKCSSGPREIEEESCRDRAG